MNTEIDEIQHQLAHLKPSDTISRRKTITFSIVLFLLIVVILESGTRLGFVVMGTSLSEQSAQFRFWQGTGEYSGDNTSKYTQHTYLPYVYRPSAWPQADAWGIRVFQSDAPPTADAFTIFTIGGSTTAGPYPEILYNYLNGTLSEENIRVVNGGIPAWTTAESLINLALRGLEYDPDLIVIYHAYNDVFPSCARLFQADYTHWRNPLPTFDAVVFDDLPKTFDHSAFYVGLRSLLVGQQQRPRGVLGATTGASRLETCEFRGQDTFRRNLISMIGIAQAHHTDVMLLTQAHRIQDASVVRQVRHVGEARVHNDIVREVAAEYDVSFIDFDIVIDPVRVESIPEDLIHLNHEGYTLLAHTIGDQIIVSYFAE